MKPVFISAFTGYVDEQEKCLQAGMDYFMTKPATADNLLKVFNEVFERE